MIQHLRNTVFNFSLTPMRKSRETVMAIRWVTARFSLEVILTPQVVAGKS